MRISDWSSDVCSSDLMLTPALSSFGLITSGSFTNSSVQLAPGESSITVPGLSRWVANSTFYFEDSGFGARISHRYRSKFLSEIFGLNATRTLRQARSEEHTSELQSLMRISYAVFCLTKKTKQCD